MELWLLILVIVCVCSSFHFFPNLLHNRKRLPPGPPTLPLVGNMFWLLKSYKNFSTKEAIVHHLQARYGPIVTIQVGSRPSIFITTHELSHRALVQSGSAFATRAPALQTIQLILTNRETVSTAPYGPLWRILRQNLMSVIHPSRSQFYSGARRWALDVLKNKLVEETNLTGKAVTVVDHFHYAMFSLFVFMCFGEKYEEKSIREMEEAQRATHSNFIRFNVLNFMPKLGRIVFRKLWKELVEIRRKQEDVMLPLIRARRQKIKNDDYSDASCCYLDSLLGVQRPDSNEKFSDNTLVSLCSEFLNGGSDTTTTTLQWLMANLVKYQNIQHKLFDEINRVVGTGSDIEADVLKRMPYLKAVVLETLRRHPPGHFILPRGVVHDTKLDGYDIPKDAMLNFNVADMGWDPNVWKDPMEFKPERFLTNNGDEGEPNFDLKCVREVKMMPFGAGRRVCPAISLAIFHLQYYVANLIRDFKWTPEIGCEVDLSEKQEFTVVMKNPLRARITPRIVRVI